MVKLKCLPIILALIAFSQTVCSGDDEIGDQGTEWVERFGLSALPCSRDGINIMGGDLPHFQIVPARTGTQLVRVSLPFMAGAFPDTLSLAVTSGDVEILPTIRVLTLHPGLPRSVRRAILTFPYTFLSRDKTDFTLSLHTPEQQGNTGRVKNENGTYHLSMGETDLTVDEQRIEISRQHDVTWRAKLIAPAMTKSAPPRIELIENGTHYVWLRIFQFDENWPRIVEIRADSLGTVAVQVHLQNRVPVDVIGAIAPDLGWDIEGPEIDRLIVGDSKLPVDEAWQELFFRDGKEIRIVSGPESLSFPLFPLTRRGSLRVRGNDNGSEIIYHRCFQTEEVPHQYMAWRRAAFVVAGSGQEPWTALLEPAHTVHLDAVYFDRVYSSGVPTAFPQSPQLAELQRYHRDAIVRTMVKGDDYGNVTGFNHADDASDYGMNRLNHCPPIFEDYYRSGDDRLRETALHWCNNFYDLSIWWGDGLGKQGFGGTRYNSARAAGRDVQKRETPFMWRTNFASDFCTKGYDSFLYAYEESGDPRMAVALRAQTQYAIENVHADQGECRNIGDVLDFARLARFTGQISFFDAALRLFRELRTKLSPGDLFSQRGKPIVSSPPFIADDQVGYQNPFAKPYILGYALAGLPELALTYPSESKLRDVIRSVADFMAESQDPLGAWRYPHPRSPGMILCQSMEHAAQLVNAVEFLERRNEPTRNLLDAIERTLRLRVLGWQKSGTILRSLGAWEHDEGLLNDGKTYYDFYKTFSDRDGSRDYTQGRIGYGSASPEGLVYFSKVLAAYAKRRPVQRLFNLTPVLHQVLGRLEDRRIRLIPQAKGSFLRIERPEASARGFLLWAPEWVTYPKLGYGQDELGGMELDWDIEKESGIVSYALDCPEAKFSATFIPAFDYVDCLYTVWPQKNDRTPSSFGAGACLQLKQGIFEGDDADLMSRTHYISDGQWTTLGSVANGNSRNVLYLRGNVSPEMSGSMAESGWRTIQSSRPDVPLIAVVSQDGQWLAATAAEHSTSICNNANASHRCIHSQGFMPLRAESPTTLRVRVYLFEGGLADLKKRYEGDVKMWRSCPAVPARSNREYVHYEMVAKLPRFRETRIKEMGFPFAYDANGTLSFAEWREWARKKYLHSLLSPPPEAPFESTLIAVEDRGLYEARKIAFNISSYSRIPAYILIPKGEGPFPAVVALHDHGAHFSIGKEKVVRPFDESPERLKDARQWVDQCYGGRFFGDELARRGYVVFAMDALFWGDRGRLEGVEYEAQQAMAANMLQLGMSWAGMIVWDDVRSAEYVAGLPEVDPERIGAMGLSMGGNRTWHLTAATDRVKIGAAICWLGTTPMLMEPGNNQTKGYSSFSMVHPGLRNALDYPDVASIACPKPMLFYNGAQDSLFPLSDVRAAYDKMHAVWKAQRAAGKLVTKIWPVPHVFNVEMQNEAFNWLDRYLIPEE